MSDLYDTDFVKWADEQAALLTERRFDLLDLDNLIEEVADLAGRHRDALESHLRMAMIHLLKLAYRQGSRDPERLWRASVQRARLAIQVLLDKFPSLQRDLAPLTRDAWNRAGKEAHIDLAEYGDSRAPFPDACPWTLEQVLDEDFFPEA